MFQCIAVIINLDCSVTCTFNIYSSDNFLLAKLGKARSGL